MGVGSFSFLTVYTLSAGLCWTTQHQYKKGQLCNLLVLVPYCYLPFMYFFVSFTTLSCELQKDNLERKSVCIMQKWPVCCTVDPRKFKKLLQKLNNYTDFEPQKGKGVAWLEWRVKAVESVTFFPCYYPCNHSIWSSIGL